MTAPAKEFLFPGAVAVHSQEHLITTVLGSCVAVCLWDPYTGTGGMNHYMLPLWNGEGLPTPRYGNIAIDRLIKRMYALDCRKENIVAKVFGGANVLPTTSGMLTVGDRNIMLADQLLQEYEIPVVVADIGGTCGRKVIFNTRTGLVLVGKRGSRKT